LTGEGVGEKVLLVCGGDCTADFLRQVCTDFRPDRIIAADGALQVFRDAGLRPDLAVGDFDTIDPEILAAFSADGVPLEQHPPEKDQTDSELAMALALRGHPSQMRFLGALGGRFDHALVNVRLLLEADRQGCRCVIEDLLSRLFLIESGTAVRRDPSYRYFSLFPVSERVEHLSLSGTKYTLSDYTAQRDRNPGFLVSNEITAPEGALVTFSSGTLLAVLSRDASDQGG